MRKKILTTLLLTTGLALPPLVAEEITYGYDARGRLVHVGRSGVNTRYSFDKADNIVQKDTVEPSAAAPPASSVTFSVANAAPVNEGTPAVFTVTKSGSTADTTSVAYVTGDGTAGAPDDYATRAGTLTFLASETSRTITIQTVADGAGEPSEQFGVSLWQPSAGTSIGTGNATGTINASAAAIFSISNAAAVDEGGTAVFTVTKSGGASGSFSVNFATANGSAVAPDDYATQSGTLTFLTSETSKTISVATVANSVAEPSEQFSVSLSSPSGGASIGTASANGTINASGSGGGGANQAPITNADSFSTNKCGTVSLNVVQNDTDPDGHYPLSLVSVGTTTYGITSIESSTNVRFKSTNQTGSGSFTYIVSDSLGATATGTVNFTVNPFAGGGIAINPVC